MGGARTLGSWQSPLTRRYSREFSESGVRTVQCYGCPTAPCGSGHNTWTGRATGEYPHRARTARAPHAHRARTASDTPPEGGIGIVTNATYPPSSSKEQQMLCRCLHCVSPSDSCRSRISSSALWLWIFLEYYLSRARSNRIGTDAKTMVPKKAQKCGNTGSPCLDKPLFGLGRSIHTAHAPRAHRVRYLNNFSRRWSTGRAVVDGVWWALRRYHSP